MKNTTLFDVSDENYYTVYCNKNKDKILVYYENGEEGGIEYTIYTMKGVEIDGGILEYPCNENGVCDDNAYTLQDLCEYANFDAYYKLDDADDIIEIIDEMEALQIKLHISLLAQM